VIGGLHCYQEGFFADSVNVLLENGEWDLFIIVLYFGSRFLVRMLELVSMDFSDSSFLPQKSVGKASSGNLLGFGISAWSMEVIPISNSLIIAQSSAFTSWGVQARSFLLLVAIFSLFLPLFLSDHLIGNGSTWVAN